MKRPNRDDQLDRELQFHIDQHAAELMRRGIAPEEARRQARLEIGGLEQVKELCRDADPRAGSKTSGRTSDMRCGCCGPNQASRRSRSRRWRSESARRP